MSNPVTPPTGTQIFLGCDGGDSFYAIGSEVYRWRLPYWWSYCTVRLWPSQSVAKRIVRRDADAAARRARERAIVEAEKQRNMNRRVKVPGSA